MLIRILRIFTGAYTPNHSKLKVKNYGFVGLGKKMLFISTPNHGYGLIRGTIKKIGASYSPVPVCVFRRDNRQLLWETKSKADGSYAFRNIAVGLECFVVAFDPNNQYNAVIQDKVIAK